MLYTIALTAHLLAVAAAFFCAGVGHVCRFILTRVGSPREARFPGMASGMAGMTFPILTVILLASGAVMAHDRWTWTTSWIVDGSVGLLLLNAIGFGVLKPRGLRLKALLVADGPTGAFSDATRAALNDDIGATAETVNHALSIAVVIVMIAKPSLFAGLGLLGAAMALPIAYRAIRASTPLRATQHSS